MTVNKAVRKKNIKRKKGKIIGGWTLVKKLGQGGNGDVWEISQEGVDNHAMKFLLSPDEVSYQRFKAEIHILSSISIDGVIPLIDSNIPETSEESTPWFTMPKAYECTDLLQKKSTLDIAESFIALIETLELLHDKKIAHRDIKPANILFYEGRLCFSDFGLVKYPKKENITPKQRDVGAKFTMAPEMRRHASEADGMPADIYSLAKTLWIFMTGQEKGFDGQYNPNSILSIKKYCSDVRTTKLDNLLVECTDNNPLMRPTSEQFKTRFKEWVEISKDFHSRNLIEWLELQELNFPAGVPAQASWTDIDSICAILAETSKIKSLNHMFFPTGGGQTLTGASIASERDMLALHTSDNSAELLKPKKLTYESFGLDSQWNYFRLEAENIEPTGVENAVWNKEINVTPILIAHLN